MPERKNDGILSLNVKKLLILHLVWKTNQILGILWKCHLDLRFLLDCKKSCVIPKFLRFKLVNRHLNNTLVYRQCQRRLLEEEIKSKRKRINTLENDTQRVKEELQRTFAVLDFSYICSLFLVTNDKSILHHDKVH